jgi:hypothetical protein
LCVEQNSKCLQSGKSHRRLQGNLHALATLFIEHPLRNDKLIAARKCYLNLMLAEGRTSSNDRDSHSAVRMMRIVNRRRNMGSV